MKKKCKNIILLMTSVVLVALLLIAVFQGKKDGGEITVVSHSDIAMGTIVSASIHTTGSEEEGMVVAEDIFSKLKEVEKTYISWREEESEIAAINSNAGNSEGTEITGKLEEYLITILEVAQKSNGAFDPTIGKLSRLWDIDGENPRVPKQEEITTLLKAEGYKNVVCQNQKVKLQENTSIDLGAVGKGIGCDEAVQILQQETDVTGAVISVGGSIVTYGEKEDKSPWSVAVTDPLHSGESYMGILSLEGENYVSTSGDYEKYFEQDGVRYHHILNPKTGYPAESGLISVTIVTDNGLLSDGLSTACFVLGLKDGMELAKEYQAEAVFIDKDYKVYITDGLKDKFQIVEETYRLQE